MSDETMVSIDDFPMPEGLEAPVPEPLTNEQILENWRKAIARWATMPEPDENCDSCEGCQRLSYDFIYRSKQPAEDGSIDCSEYSAANGWAHMTHRAGVIKRCPEHAKPAYPWAVDLDAVKVRDWMAAESAKHGDSAFVIDFDALNGLL